MSTVRTFCRICEPSCGLVAQVDDGVLVKLSPDREHPVTKGFSCHKGLAAVDLHADPDRLDHPQLRSPDGAWTTVSWDEAMAHTATRLRDIQAQHGDDAIAAYVGNPMAFNALGSLHVGQLLRALGVRRSFSSGTQDCANKFVASEAVFGSSNVHPIPDLEHTDLCLIIGENPRASQASFYSVPNVLGELRRATARGARIVFVNPRRIETLDRGIGDTVLIRPDTDVWFLAALLHEIDRLGGFDRTRHRPARPQRRGAARVHRAVLARGGGVGHRHAGRAAPRARGRLGGHAPGIGARVDRHQHGSPGHARLLARAHALLRHRSARRRRRQPEERRLLSRTRSRVPAMSSEASSTPSSVGCAAARCRARSCRTRSSTASDPSGRMIVVAGNPLLSIAG